MTAEAELNLWDSWRTHGPPCCAFLSCKSKRFWLCICWKQQQNKPRGGDGHARVLVKSRIDSKRQDSKTGEVVILLWFESIEAQGRTTSSCPATRRGRRASPGARPWERGRKSPRRGLCLPPFSRSTLRRHAPREPPRPGRRREPPSCDRGTRYPPGTPAVPGLPPPPRRGFGPGAGLGPVAVAVAVAGPLPPRAALLRAARGRWRRRCPPRRRRGGRRGARAQAQ